MTNMATDYNDMTTNDMTYFVVLDRNFKCVASEEFNEFLVTTGEMSNVEVCITPDASTPPDTTEGSQFHRMVAVNNEALTRAIAPTGAIWMRSAYAGIDVRAIVTRFA